MGASLAALPASAAPPLAANGYQCTTNAGPADPDTATKIMIAGDSITNASAGDYTWPYWLWQNLKPANVDFVGRFKDTITANTLVQGSRAYLDCDFDQDHEARPGVKLGSNVPSRLAFGSPTAQSNPGPLFPFYQGASSWMKGAVATYEPDIIVLFAGNNDVGNTSGEGLADTTPSGIATNAITNMKHVIAEARAARPGVDLVLTTAPSYTAGDRGGLYNSMLAQLVDDDPAPNDSHLVRAELPLWVAEGSTWDGLHPNATGEAKIAWVITQAINDLEPSLPDGPAAPQMPAVGPRFASVLSSSSPADNAAKLSWTLPPGTDRTVVYSRPSSGGSWFKQVDLVLPSLQGYYPGVGNSPSPCTSQTSEQKPCTTFTVTGLSGGASYDFMVRSGKGLALATDGHGDSNITTVPVDGPPAKLAVLAPVPGVHNASVRWSNSPGATGYEVRYRVAGSSTYVGATAPGTPRLIPNLVAGRRYGFQVRARNADGVGPWSSEVVAVPKANALGTGKKPVLTKVKGKRIKATWSASAGATKYQLQRRKVGGSWKTVATTSSRKVVSGKLTKGKTYEFRVRPFDGDVGGKHSPAKRRKVT